MTPEKDSAGIFKPGSIVNSVEETQKKCTNSTQDHGPFKASQIQEIDYSQTEARALAYLGKCLDEAKNIINSERQDSYESPEDSFDLIAKYWTTYLKDRAKDKIDPNPLPFQLLINLNAKDVAHMMMLFKLAYCQGQSSSRDNYIYIAGYASIAADRLSDTCKEGE